MSLSKPISSQWNNLHTDMIIYITTFLSSKDCITSVSHLNKHWKSIIYNTSIIWSNWKISYERILSQHRPYNKHIKWLYCFPSAHIIIMSNSNNNLKSFNNVVTFQINMGTNYTLDLLSIMLTTIKALPSLKYIDLYFNYIGKHYDKLFNFITQLPSNCSIQTLNISCDSKWTKHQFQRLGKLLSNVSTLKLHGSWIDFEHVASLVCQCTTVKSLLLNIEPDHVYISLKKIQEMLQPLSNLSDLDIHFQNRYEQFIYAIPKTVINLMIMDYQNIDKTPVLPQIQKLCITVLTIDQNTILNIAKQFPNLKTLQLLSYYDWYYTEALEILHQFIQLTKKIPTLNRIILTRNSYNIMKNVINQLNEQDYIEDRFYNKLERIENIIDVDL